MMTVTHQAKEVLLELRSSAHIDEPEVGMRLAPGPLGRLMLVRGRQKPADQVVQHKGAKVLLISKEYLEPLQGLVIDVCSTASGLRLRITEPGQRARE
ncbi:MAG TPA: hypothetical protein VJO34_06265 [Methylomirabilota bacterium]|nr:hypothetical protein [Methylomirabilota bacterium]